MNDLCARLANLAARALAPDERDAVLGDLSEAGESGGRSLRGVLGLVARRNASALSDWRPWLALPLGLMLCRMSSRMADHGAVHMWLYINNWDWSFLTNAGYRHDLLSDFGQAAIAAVILVCVGSISGFVLGVFSRERRTVMTAILFASMLFLGELIPPRVSGGVYRARDARGNAAVFEGFFYRIVFPFLVQALLVAVPAVWAMRRSGVVRRFFCGPLLLLVAMAGVAAAADAPAVRAAIRPDADRKPAPEVVLKDRSGKLVKLKKYRGKVVLLDFWATWCTGCKMEIPWFAEFQKNYGRNGLTVVGVAMDDEGWKIVKPFLAEHHVPYRTVVGEESTMKEFGLQNLPDTFLIDRRGRVAAAYLAGLVDRENIEANLKVLLADKR